MNTMLLMLCLWAGSDPALGGSALAESTNPSETVAKTGKLPSAGTTILYVPENSPAGTVVGVAASAADGAAKSSHYALGEGNSGDAFAIDPESGRITVNNGSPLDFETQAPFQITVQVTTTNDPEDENQKRFLEQLRKSGADEETIAQSLRKIFDRRITIELINVNEPPVFDERAFQIDGRSETGAVVGALTATDPDQKDLLRYTTGDDATDRGFSIDATTGSISVRDPAVLHSASDHGGPARLQASFQVEDRGGLIDVASVTIVIDPAAVKPNVATVPPINSDTESVTREPVEAERPSTPLTAAVEPAPETNSEPQPVHQAEVADIPLSGTEAPQPVDELPSEIETPISAQVAAPAAGGSGGLAGVLNLLFLFLLAAGGIYIYRLTKTHRSTFERLRAEENRIDAQCQSLEFRELALANERTQIEQQKEQIDARARELEAQQMQLESQRAELTEVTARIQEERISLDSEKQQLIDAAEELERLRQEWVAQKASFTPNETADHGSPMNAVETAEQLVHLAIDDQQPVEAENSEVAELRHRLADMFGVSESELVRQRPQRIETEYEGIVKAKGPEPAASATRSGSVVTAAAPVATISSPAVKEAVSVEEVDSVASYMRDLLERQRVKQLYGPSAIVLQVEAPRPTTTSPALRTSDMMSSAEPAAVPNPDEPPKAISNTPIHPQDKDAVRSGLSSLREVANQAARSAVLRHAKKKLRNHSMIKIGSAAVAFLTASVIFSGSITVTSMLGWAAAGIGLIMLVDLIHWTYVSRKNAQRPTKDS